MYPLRPRSQRPLVPRHKEILPIKRKPSNHSNLLALFKNTDGQLDLEKITSTVEQANQLYGQVSPLFSRFFNNQR